MVELKEKGFQLVYVGDVVGTGSSRKSATNSVLWYMGEDIPFVPNKRGQGLCIGGKIAPIFFNTMEDSGALPLEMDVTNLNMGDVIEVYPYEGVVKRHGTEEVITTFELKTDVLFDEVRPAPRCRTPRAPLPHARAPLPHAPLPHVASPHAAVSHRRPPRAPPFAHPASPHPSPPPHTAPLTPPPPARP